MGFRTGFFSVVFFLTLNTLFAQKIIKKTLINPESKSFQLDVTNSYQVNLSTSDSQEIIIAATLDGEYQKDLLVGIEEEGSNVMITAGFQPNFVNPNDKLSAHKVVSIALDVVLPRNVTATVFGTQANVVAKGVYERLNINLSDGDCRLKEISEKIEVKTQTGNIYLNTKSGDINAQSSYGELFTDSIPLGNTIFNLRSVEGDIHVKRTK